MTHKDELLQLNGQISTTEIASNAVTSGKLAADAVTTAKIADDAVTAAKLADTLHRWFLWF